jgi:hypothetical protein
VSFTPVPVATLGDRLADEGDQNMANHMRIWGRRLVAAVALSLGAAVLAPLEVVAGGDEDAAAAKIKTSKHSLAEGVQAAQKENGVAVSAKIEFEDGKLWLSVYTAKAGLEKDAEHNVLVELKGDTTTAKWEPKLEVFEDKKHLARSAAQLTAMQSTTLTIEDVIKKAAAQKKGTVFSVIPAVKDGRTVFDVLLATPAGKSVHLTIDESTK